jgi:hypothetical protein
MNLLYMHRANILEIICMANFPLHAIHLYTRNNMFELADRLVGIYKTSDTTKSVTIDPRLFADATMGRRPQQHPAGALSSSAAGMEKTAAAHYEEEGSSHSSIAAKMVTTAAYPSDRPLGDITNKKQMPRLGSA